MLDIRRIWVFIFFTVVFFEVWVELARAGKIDREKDCGKSKPCLKVYRQEKNAWWECLEQADVPE